MFFKTSQLLMVGFLWEIIAFLCPLSSTLQIFISLGKLKKNSISNLNISICIPVLFIFIENSFFSYTIYPQHSFPSFYSSWLPPPPPPFCSTVTSPIFPLQKREILQKQQPNKMKQDAITRQTPSY